MDHDLKALLDLFLPHKGAEGIGTQGRLEREVLFCKCRLHKALLHIGSCIKKTDSKAITIVMLKSDRWIKQMAKEQGMIAPFVEGQVKELHGKRMVSYGLSSYGYDLRISDEFKVFTNAYCSIVDPKNFTEDAFVDICGESCLIPPNSFALARSIEYFRIPRNILTMCIGKSTYARCGIIVNVTPFEPEWEGYVTIEISNTTPLPARVYANEGIAQVLFFEADEICQTSYADRQGKYQRQEGITVPRV